MPHSVAANRFIALSLLRDGGSAIYRPKEAARLLGLSMGTFYAGVRSGNRMYPTPFRLAGMMRFTEKEIHRCQDYRQQYYRETGRGDLGI